jgi:hypothetical protein
MARLRCVFRLTVLGVVLAPVLGGCALVRPLFSYVEPKAPAPAMTAFTNPSCQEVARQRAEDAAVNGYDADVQARTARDAYAGCMDLEKQKMAVQAP